MPCSANMRSATSRMRSRTDGDAGNLVVLVCADFARPGRRRTVFDALAFDAETLGTLDSVSAIWEKRNLNSRLFEVKSAAHPQDIPTWPARVKKQFSPSRSLAI